MAQIDLLQYYLVTLLIAEAKTHDASIQFAIAFKYWHLGDAAKTKQKTSECYLKSAKWLKKSESQGLSEAGYLLGFFYENGIGVKQNFKKTFSLFMKYAEVNLLAAFGLAECYETGMGVERNIEKALNWYKKAANGDNREVIKFAEERIKFISLQKAWNEKNMDFVIVDKKKNYAIGLRWHKDEYPAPIITKRETGERAKKLCDSANKSSITIIENESFARGLYSDTFIGFLLPEKYIDINIFKDVLVTYIKTLRLDIQF